ncbi:O-methyltransferase [bacterium]|nr:O-methyltransferase [bacterium]
MSDWKIFHQPVEVFLAQLGKTNVPELLSEMQDEAVRRGGFPIVGPEVGRFFLQLARLRRPKRILELGSGYGYSAIWWALGAGPDVEIQCTEYKQENADAGMEYARRAGVADCITYHVGDALENAAKLEGPWDIIFADIDKIQYPRAYDFAKEHMRSGDLLMFDNMLRHGDVANPDKQEDETVKAIVGLDKRAFSDPDMDASLIPIRDGILLTMRK